MDSSAFYKVLAQEEILWLQKSRAKWLECGDRNTRYFHRVATVRRRRNHITALQNEAGKWVDNTTDLESLATNYYMNLFSTDSVPEPLPLSHSFPILEEEDISSIARAVTDEQIFNTIKNFGALKAPGPDGFQAIFYHSQWQVVGPSFC